MFVSVNLCQARYQYASSIAPQHPESYGASQRLIELVLALRLFHRIPVPQGFDPLVLALQVFPRKLLMRLLAFALHLLGARRKEVAALVEMPEESVKTLLRLVSLDGFAALRDRRCGASVTRQANRPTMR